MITAINESNYNNYNILFEKATELLSKQDKYAEGVAINSLEDYFCLIEDLVEYGGKQYTILPLDEECFKIHANERLIEVPDAFKKNGIAVQGDEVAEIVYFKIDRYFDFVDLNNTDIYIQWKSLATDINNPPSGISREWVRDIESEPGKLIFGWPLDSSITQVAGPIKFSVRFIMWETDDDDKIITPRNIVYSFSTLDAQATINPALDCDESELESAADLISDVISKRIKNSKPSDDGNILPPPNPIFTYHLPTEEIDLNTSIDENGVTHYQYTLKVQADTNKSTGTLSYTWEREYNGNTFVLNESKIDYLLSEDEAAVPDSIYYILDNNKFIAKPLTVGQNLKTGIDKNGEPVNDTYYEKFNIYNIDVTENGEGAVGNYYVTATTTKGIAPNHKTASTKEGPAKIPAPEKPEIVFVENLDPIIRFDREKNKYICNLMALGQTADKTDNGESKNKDTIIKAIWSKGGSSLEEQTYNNNSTSINTKYVIESDEFDTNLQGVYTVQVKTQRNGVTEYEDEDIMVTYPALMPNIEYSQELIDNKYSVDRGKVVEISVNYGDNDYQNSNNLTKCEWYASESRAGEYEAVKINEIPVIGQSIDTSKVKYGYIKCLVTNTYNNDIVSAYSEVISIVG